MPWPLQLGRQENADLALLRLLEATAQVSAGEALTPTRLRLIGENRPTPPPPCPAALGEPGPDLPPPETPPTSRPALACPVLEAVVRLAEQRAQPDTLSELSILDLRGDRRPKNVDRALRELQHGVGARSPVLILGDDPILDGCKWLRINRVKHTVTPANVRWAPEDQPTTCDTPSVRLMNLLTECGVLIRDWSAGKDTHHDNTTTKPS